uniref:Uncharacterized protein n=1 Tax=Anguilla anguilla TaxID=7936 RepID=A0A0E9PQ97_ANGAN
MLLMIFNYHLLNAYSLIYSCELVKMQTLIITDRQK